MGLTFKEHYKNTSNFYEDSSNSLNFKAATSVPKCKIKNKKILRKDNIQFLRSLGFKVLVK